MTTTTNMPDLRDAIAAQLRQTGPRGYLSAENMAKEMLYVLSILPATTRLALATALCEGTGSVVVPREETI